jgi:hypothetical protein
MPKGNPALLPFIRIGPEFRQEPIRHTTAAIILIRADFLLG